MRSYIFTEDERRLLILGLIGYSLIIIYSNFLCILTIQAILAPNLLHGMGVTEIGMLVLTLNNLFLHFGKVKQTWMYLEANVAAVVFLGPPILWRPFFQWYLREQPLFYFAYLASVLTVLAVVFYIANGIVKEWREI